MYREPYDFRNEKLVLPVIEDAEIAHLVRERAAVGGSGSLADVALGLGLDPDDYR
ncbi:hypothetical protein SRABI02_02357 [Plantibacter cousiniae]|nr:hypothetical protein SRABI02_02357 [Plantibacter cousiniae]